MCFFFTPHGSMTAPRRAIRHATAPLRAAINVTWHAKVTTRMAFFPTHATRHASHAATGTPNVNYSIKERHF